MVTAQYGLKDEVKHVITRRLFGALFLCVVPFIVQATESGLEDAVAGQEFLLRAAEYADYQIPATERLSNQQLTWAWSDGTTGRVTIGVDASVESYVSDGVANAVSAEVFEVAAELFYLSFPLDGGARAMTLIVDRLNGRVIAIESRRPAPDEGTHQAQVHLSQGTMSASTAPPSELMPTDAMAGVRLIAHYADDIAYEHIYLNPHRVTWHGIDGPEAGVADTEKYAGYQIRDNIYLVSWSEKVLTTHMIFVFDFETGHEIGTIFGYEPEHDKAVLETIGAKTQLLSAPWLQP